jgi:tRNA (guanine-N7-)-methyltransferase
VSPFVLSRAIDRFLVPWPQLDWPVDWTACFGRDGPLHLELGFGNGECTEHAALIEPSAHWVGAEVSWASVVRLLKRINQTGIENIRVLHGDGAFALQGFFPPNSLAEVVINHSDPWPKKRHHRRRLIKPELIRILGNRLRKDGRVVIVTDHEEYAQWITEVLEQQTVLRSEHSTPWVDNLPGHRPTKYKRKGVEAGSTIFHFVWRKTGEEAEASPVREKVNPMPNVLLEGECSFDELMTEFKTGNQRTTYRDVPIFVQLASAYRRQDGAEWLVEARTKEGSYSQHFALSVCRRGDDRVLIKPSAVGVPRPTWAVKRAVRQLAEQLLDLHPGLRVYASAVEGLGAAERGTVENA